MSDSDSDAGYKGTKEVATKKRKFRETHTGGVTGENSSCSRSRSPSPALPSRLDRIPSPSFDVKIKSQTKNDVGERLRRISENNGKVEERTKERNRSRSRSLERKRKQPCPNKRKDSRRSDSRSPVRKRKPRSRSPRRNKKLKSPVRRRRSRSRSRDRRRRSRSDSRERKRRSRSRSRERRRSRSRSRGGRRSRSRSRERRRNRGAGRRRRSRSPYRSPSPQFTSKWGMRRSHGLTRAVLPANSETKKALTTEEVEARVAVHMKEVKVKAAEEAKKINLPGYLNPAMVNVHQFKQVQDKRKLLWSKTKDKKEGATQWVGAFDDQDNDEKFKRLMGIQGIDVESDTSKLIKSRQVLDDLEKEYEKSRAFQLSRGAGGLTGIGLGFGCGVPQP